IVATPRLVAVHLGREIEEELSVQRLGAVCARLDRCVEAAIDDVVEIDAGGFPVDERNTARLEISLRALRPVVRPCVVDEMNLWCATDPGVGVRQCSGTIIEPEQCPLRRGEQGGASAAPCRAGSRATR